MDKKGFREILLKISLDLYGDVLQKNDLDRIIVQYPKKELGHYASSVAMVLSKTLKKQPKEIAMDYKTSLEKESFCERVDIAGPGFINIFFNKETLVESLLNFKDNLNKPRKKKNKKVLLEYVSANPTGPLHIGHGRWATVGSSLSNVLTYLGYDVFQENYINDHGSQIENLKKTAMAIKEDKPIPKDGYHGEYMKIFKDIDDDPVDYFLADHDRLLRKMHAYFDQFFRESSLYTDGLVDESIEEIRKKNIIYEREGATWFRTTSYGDDKDRVIIKKNGEMTYYLSDVAYHRDKVKRGFDILINILGADHHGYIKRLEAIVEVFSEGKKISFRNVVGQLVSLFRNGKPIRMSKRAGDMVTLEEVIDEIGVDATRYYLSMRSMNSPLDFDLEMAKSKNSENPIYYIQYAHARICSILRKLEEENIDIGDYPFDYSLIKSAYSDEILLHILRFNDVLEEVEKTLQIYYICNYLYELSCLFHRYYIEVQFIDKLDLAKTSSHIFFIKTIKGNIQKGLEFLGINAMDKM